MKKVLVTGAAGFIGFHFSRKLLDEGHQVVGLDNISGYYDISLKLARLNELGINKHLISEGAETQSDTQERFTFVKADLQNKQVMTQLFEQYGFDYVVNLAAQAGVRYSVENPQVYIDANINGFLNVLEHCRRFPVEHLVYASSSSVYGANEKKPFSVHDNVDHPLSLYAATKKSNELMAHSYSHLFEIPATGLRFFTVYGPWGRPDMALYLFANAITKDQPIKVFNNGKMARDFTYVDDIVNGMVKVMHKPAVPNDAWSGTNPDPGSSKASHRVYNIGLNAPVKLMDFIAELEKAFGKEAKKDFLPMQAGDVPETYAEVSDLFETFNFKPKVTIKEGIQEFVKWYKHYYKVN